MYTIYKSDGKQLYWFSFRALFRSTKSYLVVVPARLKLQRTFRVSRVNPKEKRQSKILQLINTAWDSGWASWKEGEPGRYRWNAAINH